MIQRHLVSTPPQPTPVEEWSINGYWSIKIDNENPRYPLIAIFAGLSSAPGKERRGAFNPDSAREIGTALIEAADQAAAEKRRRT